MPRPRRSIFYSLLASLAVHIAHWLDNHSGVNWRARSWSSGCRQREWPVPGLVRRGRVVEGCRIVSVPSCECLPRKGARRNPRRPHHYVSCSRLHCWVCIRHYHPGKRCLSTGCRRSRWPAPGSARRGRAVVGYTVFCHPPESLILGGSHAVVAHTGCFLARSWPAANVTATCHGIRRG